MELHPFGAPDQQKPLKKHSAVQRKWDFIGYKTPIQRCGSMHSCSVRLLSLPSKLKRSGMRSMRMRLSSTCFPKKLMHCAHSRFPLIYSVSSGYGRRTSGHGAGSISCRIKRQRLSSIRLKTTEIPTSTKRSGGMHHSGSISPYRLKRGMKPDKPVKSPVWQTDEDEISLGENGVHDHRKY